jgi:hypothetical protein
VATKPDPEHLKWAIEQRSEGSQVDFVAAVLHVRRVKKGTPATHPLRGDEMRALRKLQRESAPSPFVFTSERGAPFGPEARCGSVCVDWSSAHGARYPAGADIRYDTSRHHRPELWPGKTES